MPTLVPSTPEKLYPATQQPWPAERKIDLILEGVRGRRPVAEICREVGISPSRYYQWRQQIIDAARAGLAYPEKERRALQERVQRLEAENASLQRQLLILQELCVAD